MKYSVLKKKSKEPEKFSRPLCFVTRCKAMVTEKINGYNLCADHAIMVKAQLKQ